VVVLGDIGWVYDMNDGSEPSGGRKAWELGGGSVRTNGRGE